MESEIIIILVAAVFLIAAFCISLFARLIHIKNRLREISSTLDDISAGHINHKILARPDEITAAICYQINGIVSCYQNRLIELEKAADTNRQLMTSLSHDVRTPLTTLLGYLDAVHKNMVNGQEREDYIETARKKAHDLKEYIDVLFDWFKLNSNEETISMEPHEIAELTRNLLKDWIPVFEEKALDYDIDIPQSRLMASVDIDGYTRVINNLIQNVIAHSGASKIEIGLFVKSENINISVADNGTGIPAEDLKHIFERLYKCDKGRSEKGSGLGLNIVWQLVNKMGGRISAESEPGKHTVFTVTFPLVE